MEFSDEFVVSNAVDLTPGPKIASVTQGIVQQRFFFWFVIVHLCMVSKFQKKVQEKEKGILVYYSPIVYILLALLSNSLSS